MVRGCSIKGGTWHDRGGAATCTGAMRSYAARAVGESCSARVTTRGCVRWASSSCCVA